MRMTVSEFENWQQRQLAMGGKPAPRTTPVTQAEKAACVADLPAAKGTAPTPKFKSKTEAEYHRMLELRQKAGEIVWFKHEAINLKLGDDCRFLVDFFVMKPDGEFLAVEVKGGFIRPDSLVKIRVAASMFPFRFLMAQKTKEGWVEKGF